MRMDRSCCWKGDVSALSRGKVTILVGRACLVPVNTASCPVCGCPMIRPVKTSTGRFAEVLGVHRTYMGGLERGERNLTLRSLERIAEQMGVEVEELMR